MRGKQPVQMEEEDGGGAMMNGPAGRGGVVPLPVRSPVLLCLTCSWTCSLVDC